MAEEPNYEPEYYKAVAKVQELFPLAPTPGEVVRALERMGWRPQQFARAEVLRELADWDALAFQDGVAHEGFVRQWLGRLADEVAAGGDPFCDPA